jgi:hypothetical protein
VKTKSENPDYAGTDCTGQKWLFPSFKKRKVEAEFSGGNVSSDGGVLLLREVDRRVGLTRRLAEVLPDERVEGRCDHRLRDLLRQRIYGLCLGYEDLNDHESLRSDVALQTAVEHEGALASSSTLCRLEQRADRRMAVWIHEVLIEKFIESHRQTPKELVLDFDTTDDPVHGKQEGRFFHGYYDRYCFLPLYVFCGDQLLVSYLRPSNIDPAKHAWAILARVVRRLRAAWPRVKIIIRGDSGFCRWQMMRWCDRHGVSYILGVGKNNRLNGLAEPWMKQAAAGYEAEQRKQRVFADLEYAADTWDRTRRVILKAEHTDKGANPRYVVTNLEGNAQELYERVYCARGEMENRIKEQQLGLFADRTSCHCWWANQWRLLLSSAAYVLMEAIRRLGLRGTELAQAQVGTIRLKLLKIGAIVIRNSRRVRLLLSSSYPFQRLFLQVAARLAGG